MADSCLINAVFILLSKYKDARVSNYAQLDDDLNEAYQQFENWNDCSHEFIKSCSFQDLQKFFESKYSRVKLVDYGIEFMQLNGVTHRNLAHENDGQKGPEIHKAWTVSELKKELDEGTCVL